MDNFETDLAAFVMWWCSGGHKVRRRSTVDEYVRHLRQWMRWQQAQPGEPTTIPTLRPTRAYIAEVREHREWNAYTSIKALKSWCRFLVDDGLVDVDPLITSAQPRPARPTHAPTADVGRHPGDPRHLRRRHDGGHPGHRDRLSAAAPRA